jgi:predicted PurR-regulated permease PerM
MFKHGLDRRAASYTWTVLFILLLLAVVYLIRETLFVFALAMLFAYLLWPLVHYLDRCCIERFSSSALDPHFLDNFPSFSGLCFVAPPVE